jgi:hypothetical protein
MAIRDLVALKFKSGIHSVNGNGTKAGHQSYPDFNQVSLATRKGMDWCDYIDAFGIGMQYDKTCGHKNETVDSPYGEQLCVIAVLQDFATEALALFPSELTQLTPVEFEAFYNDKAHKHEQEEIVDQEILDAIAKKEALGLPVPEKADAIDVTTESRGVRKNHNRYFADLKKKVGVNIV